MRIVALETSTGHGSVAALDGQQVLVSVSLPHEQRTAQSLAPALQQLLDTTGWPTREIDLVAVTRGPGSFTGLRIAVTTAKLLAYATHAELVALDTLSVIAHQLPPGPLLASPVLSAQRGQWFAALHQRRDTAAGWQERQACRVVDPADWIGALPAGSVLTGPVLRRLSPQQLPDHVQLAAPECWTPTAEQVGRLAWQAYQDGRRDDLWTLTPSYYRPSYAEEKRPRG